MTIAEIKNLPTCYMSTLTGESHESLLRSFQTLQKVKEMLKRGDSQETILEFIEECYYEDERPYSQTACGGKVYINQKEHVCG